MAHAVESLDALIKARHLQRGTGAPGRIDENRWSRASLSGRLVEICAASASASLTAALGLVLNTQHAGETAAWVTAVDSTFFPPDAARGGVCLDTLAVIRLGSPDEIPVAADKLVRSGAFGLVVMDLTTNHLSVRGQKTSAPPHRGGVRGGAWAARLAGLARKHDTAVVILTDERSSSAPLGPLISLKGEARRGTDWEVEIKIVRDKQAAPGWSHAEPCRAPDGLR